MIAELLSVGTELLLGEIVDTNSAWLAQDLARRGVDVYWSQRVGDNRKRLKRAVEEALSRSDLLIMCGGLGPTDDDMSREAVAETLGETPEVDAGLERELRARFASFSVSMPERNLKQAWLIPSAEALPNPLGTAPGWFVRTRRGEGEKGGQEKMIVALPGPPRELKRMWLEEAVPRLELPTAALFTRTFKTQGVGESAVAERLGELTLAANPSVATYAKRDGVHVRVAAKADTLAEAESVAERALERVGEALEGFVWGYDGDELPEVVRRLLALKNASAAVMETATGGGLIQSLSVADASAPLLGGVVAWEARTKAAFGVPEPLCNAPHAVSQDSALAMAEAAARLFGADYGLATTEVTKVTGSDEGQEAYVAVFGPGLGSEGGSEGRAKRLRLPRLEPDWVRERLTYAALAFFWQQLRA